MNPPPDTPSGHAFVHGKSVASRLGAAGWTHFALAGLLAAGATFFLAPQWRHNPDLPHGWFMPVVFVWLWHESRTQGTQRFLRRGSWQLAAVGACVVAALAALALGILYMAVLEWTHALVVLMMTVSLCGLLAAFWLAGADERLRWLPFNWPAGVAIFLWLLSIPMPPGTYATLTQTLQSFVTDTVLRLLHFCGIAAVRQGNILQLTDVTVGVEEACSGVRSLLSCLYTGLFLSAALVRRFWPRACLVALAGPLAVAMNVVRSFALTLMAHRGVELGGFWHDLTGYAVLGLTAAVLAGLAVWLEQRNPPVSENSRQTSAPLTTGAAEVVTGASGSAGVLWPQRLAFSGVVAAAAMVGVLFFNLRPATVAKRTPPDLAALLPAAPAGWAVRPDRELYRFADELQTTHLAQTIYQRPNPAGGEPQEIVAYLAYWPAGTAPVSVVATHTPDACWPGSGWEIQRRAPAPSPADAPPGSRFRLAEYRLFGLQGHIRHVWYWHLYDGRVIQPANVRSPRQLLFLAWRYGFRREGEQLFVRLSSNLPLEKLAQEPILEEIFTRLAPFGL